jgi:hypothetical protein
MQSCAQLGATPERQPGGGFARNAKGKDRIDGHP